MAAESYAFPQAPPPPPVVYVKRINGWEWFEIVTPLVGGMLSSFAGVWALSSNPTDAKRMRAASFGLALGGMILAVSSAVSAYARAQARIEGSDGSSDAG
jgi:hypothetical protein